MAFNPGCLAGAITAATAASIAHNMERNNVVNKTIVYSDTVLSLKDNGKNLKVTKILNVDESSFYQCLDIIFDSNPDVIFNTIQYSRENETIYFYTNKEISKKKWEDRGVIEYKPLTSSTEILESIKELFNQEKCKDFDSIALYDVLNLMKGQYKKVLALEGELRDNLKEIIKDNGIVLIWINFDSYNKKLTISWNENKIIFVKKDGDLTILESNYYKANDMLIYCGKQISEYCDKCLENVAYEYQKSEGIKSINSSFFVNIDKYEVSIFSGKIVSLIFGFFEKTFELSARSYDSTIYEPFKYKCNSSNVGEVIKNNEVELFKKIFVKIQDCPTWAQQSLYEIRQNQLAEEQKIEEEKRQQEMKKQKRLEFKRKIFPWLKNKE